MTKRKMACAVEKRALQQDDAVSDRKDNSKALEQFLEHLLKVRAQPWTQKGFLNRLVSNKVNEWVNEWRITEEALKCHKTMWDIMRCDKAGMDKDIVFGEWCTKIRKHAELANTEFDFYKLVARDVITTVPTPKRFAQDPLFQREYQMTDETRFSHPHKSWLNGQLRKYLGDYRIARYIYHHGVPDILDGDAMDFLYPRGMSKPKELTDELEELMRWYNTVLNCLLNHKSRPDVHTAHFLSCSDNKQLIDQRREDKDNAKRVYGKSSTQYADACVKAPHCETEDWRK